MVKSFRRIARKIGRDIKKRYVRTTVSGRRKYGNYKVQNIVRDLGYLKAMVNAEKKNVVSNTTSSQTVAVANGVGPGYYFAPILPTIAKGTDADQRLGNSIKLHSMALRFRAQQQASGSSPIKLNFMLLKAPGRQPTVAGTINSPAPVTDETVVKTIFKVNPFTDDVDYFSARNPDTYTDWIVLASKNVTLRADQLTSQVMINQGIIAKKFKSHHIRWVTGVTQPDEGQIYLLVRASFGDTNTSTGARIEFVNDFYFYDN